MAVDPPADLQVPTLGGRTRSLQELLTTFHLLFVAFDPYEEPSSWLLETAVRVLDSFDQADVRVAAVVTANASDTRLWLGPHVKRIRTITDPDRTIVKAFGLSQLPAIVFLGMDGVVHASAEGWDPEAWQKVVDRVAEVTAWTAPTLPGPKDPAPFAGSPV